MIYYMRFKQNLLNTALNTNLQPVVLGSREMFCYSDDEDQYYVMTWGYGAPSHWIEVDEWRMAKLILDGAERRYTTRNH